MVFELPPYLPDSTASQPFDTRKIMKFHLSNAFFAAGLLLATTSHAATDYKLTDLGATQVWGAINNSGEMFGGERGGNGIFYRNGQVDSLGYAITGYWNINDRGDVTFNLADEDKIGAAAFLPRNGTLQEIPEWTSGGISYKPQPIALNNSGVVVGSGYSAYPLQNAHAFVYENGQIRDLGTLGGSSASANAINNAGAIVGSSTTANGVTRAFLYTNGVMAQLPIVGSATAQQINDDGVIVGEWGYPRQDAFWIYDHGVVTVVEVAGAYNLHVKGLNNAGQIAGTHFTDEGNKSWIYDEGEFHYLADLADVPGYQLYGIMDFNDRGELLIDADGPDATVVTVLLSPVPEPTTYAMLAIGAGIIVARRRYQQQADRA
jgi:probable HAF family extracellular repeat protein